MNNAITNRFSKLRAMLWPIYAYELLIFTYGANDGDDTV